MKIYDYSNIKSCLICGSIDEKIDKFIKTVVSSLRNTENYKVETHPKELERQARLREMVPENDRNILRRVSTIGKYQSRNKCQHLLNDIVLIVNGSNLFIGKDLKYYIQKLEVLNNVLVDNNAHILFVRGNDDPTYFKDELINLSNIKTIVDYSVVKLNKFNCLCIGGCISLSRKWKIDQEKLNGRRLYWKEEEFCYDEQEINNIIKEFSIACIITNSCPSFAYPSMNVFNQSSWVEKDKKLLHDICQERSKMDKIYNIINAKKPYLWVYSRFNMSNSSVVNDIIFESIQKFQFISFNEIVKKFFKIDFSKQLKENNSIINDDQYKKLLYYGINMPTTFLDEYAINEIDDGRVDGNVGELVDNHEEEDFTIAERQLEAVEPINYNDFQYVVNRP